MAFNQKVDAITATGGSVILTKNGQNINLGQTEELTWQIAYKVTPIQTIGQRMAAHKITSAEGSGQLKMYLTDSSLYADALNWIATGSAPVMSITATIEDPTSPDTGKQTVLLSNVIFDTITGGALESKDGYMEFSTKFTFDASSLINQFNS